VKPRSVLTRRGFCYSVVLAGSWFVYSESFRLQVNAEAESGHLDRGAVARQTGGYARSRSSGAISEDRCANRY
jgi:hypothetical protein